uniref:Uncharacterized protein n=1 Tax=Kalanchoe fedtschenkoi TaxID=63787 RepID=A0A7N0V4D7_KALFE
MDESFRIQVSSRLVDQLAKDADKLKKKTKKPKPKIPHEPRRPEVKEQKKVSDDSEKQKETPAAGWPLQPPFFVPVNPVHSASAEIEAIRAVLEQSEKVLDRLQKQEAEMLQEVTKKAKDLHDKEFTLPEPKTIPCLDEKNACAECYKENAQNPLKCASVTERFADCARRVRQQMSSPAKLAT